MINQGFIIEKSISRGHGSSLCRTIKGRKFLEEVCINLLNTKLKNNYKKLLLTPPKDMMEFYSQSKILDKELNSTESNIFKILSDMRIQIAKKEKVKPELIFSDVSLYDMMKKNPSNKEEFLLIDGIDKYRCQKYGQDFIEVLSTLNDFYDVDISLDFATTSSFSSPTITTYAAAGHTFTVTPVSKVGGMMEGKWAVHIKGPKVTGKEGIKTLYSEPALISSKSMVAKFVGCAPTDFILVGQSPDFGQNKKDTKKDTKEVTYDLFQNKKMDVKQISKVRGIQSRTVEDHLVSLYNKSYKIDIGRLGFNDNIFKKIKEVIIKSSKGVKLRIIKDSLPKEISYLHIKMAMVKMKK